MAEVLKVVLSGENKTAIAAINDTRKSIFNLKLELEKYQSMAFTEKDQAKVRAYNKRIQELEVSIKQASNAGKVGFDSMGNAVAKSTGALGNSFSALRNIAYIVPGIGLAGIFNLAFEAIGKAAGELEIFAKKQDFVAKGVEDLNKEMVSARESAAAEVSHLKALVDVAQNVSISNKNRLQAVKDLREQYPAYFKDLTNEQILTGHVTTATDELTKAIYQRAEARAREADIAKKAAQVYENQQKIDALQIKIDAKRIELAKKRETTDLSSTGRGLKSGAEEIFYTQREENTLLKEKDKLLTENSTLQIQIASSQNMVNQITAKTIDLDEKEVKVKKEKVKQWHALVGAIRETIPYNKKDYEEKKPKKGDIDFLETPKHLSGGKYGSGILDEDFQRNAENNKKKQDEFNDSLRAASDLANAAANSFQGLFNNLQQGMNFGEALGKMFEDLASQIAAAAAKAAIFSLILNAVTGGGAGVAGAVGGSKGGGFFDLFKGLLGFAEGGTVTGPASGYPVMLHNTEHIVRPDQMKSIIGGAAQMGMNMSTAGTQRIEIVGRLSGNDIYLSQNRTEFYRNIRT